MSKVFGTLPGSSEPAPAAPELLRVERMTAGLVSLTWGWATSGSTGTPTSWQVYRDGVAIGDPVALPTYTDSTVTPSTAFDYQVQAFNDGGGSELSAVLAVTTPANTLPVWTLTDQTLTLGAAYTLDLSTVCSDADEQTLSFSIAAGTVPGLSIVGQALTGTPTTAGAPSLTLDAFDGYDHAQVTVTFTVVDTDNTAPSVPTGVLAVANGSTVTVTWSASTDPSGISAYRVRRDDVFRGSVAGDVLQYIETGVPDGTYVYQIRAVDNSANLNTSASSTGSTVTVQVAAPTPDVPTNLAVASTSSSQLDVSWAAGPNGPAPTGYRLQRATALAGTYATVYEGAATSFSDTGLSALTTRYYKVLAKNGASESAYSTPASGTTQNVSSGPADFIVPLSTAARTISNATNTAYTGVSWASLATGGKTRPTSGDVIEFASGTHGKVTLTIVGSSTSRITVRASQTARSIFSAVTDFVVTVRDCRYLTIDGGEIGANYGFLFTQPAANSGAGHIVKYKGVNHHVTLRNFEVDGKRTSWSGSPAIAIPVGVGLHDNAELMSGNPEGTFQDNLIVENGYVHNVAGEGVYGGPNWETQAVPMSNITIRNLLVEDTGRDGVQLKAVYEGTNVVDNVVCRRTGRNNSDRDPGQLFGISIACGTARVSNCEVYDSGESGIQFYTQNGPNIGAVFYGHGPYTNFPVEAYNCLVVRAGEVGKTMGSNANAGNGIIAGRDPVAGTENCVPPLPNFYNNTVADCDNAGINIGSGCAAGGTASNNVLIGNGQALSLGVSTTNVGNYTSGTPFVSSSRVFDAAGDYHLTLARPVSGTAVASVDLDGDTRSLATADAGCYEYP